jgi:hypothetical protein
MNRFQKTLLITFLIVSFGLVILVACAPQTGVPAGSDDAPILRWVDHEYGVVCYYNRYNSNALSCLGPNQLQLIP